VVFPGRGVGFPGSFPGRWVRRNLAGEREGFQRSAAVEGRAVWCRATALEVDG
jgi:hypothetical protein